MKNLSRNSRIGSAGRGRERSRSAPAPDRRRVAASSSLHSLLQATGASSATQSGARGLPSWPSSPTVRCGVKPCNVCEIAFFASDCLDTAGTPGYPLRFLTTGCGIAGSAGVRQSRGCSSVGRALEWHSRGQGFDSPRLHGLISPNGCPVRRTPLGRPDGRGEAGIWQRSSTKVFEEDC